MVHLTHQHYVAGIAVPFTSEIASPVVVASVMSFMGSDYVTTRALEATSQSVELWLQEEEGIDNYHNETAIFETCTFVAGNGARSACLHPPTI
jgi:hypothetical protein